MTDKISTVLLAGIGRGPFKAIAPVLDQHVADLLDVAPRAAARSLKFHGDGRERIEAVLTGACVGP